MSNSHAKAFWHSMEATQVRKAFGIIEPSTSDIGSIRKKFIRGGK